jgi:hypothetical protein
LSVLEENRQLEPRINATLLFNAARSAGSNSNSLPVVYVMTGSSVNVGVLSLVVHVSATPAFGGNGQVHNAPDVICDANATHNSTRDATKLRHSSVSTSEVSRGALACN